MRLYRFLFIFMLCTVQSVYAGYLLDLKSITLDTFFGKEIKDDSLRAALGTVLNLSIDIPKDYVLIEPDQVPSALRDYIFWTDPAVLQKGERTNGPSAPKGFLYGGYISQHDHVDYDKQLDMFIGLEDEVHLRMAEKKYQDFSCIRYEVDDYPILLCRGTKAKTGKYRLWAYVGTNLGKDLLFISFQPPGNSHMIGDMVWDSLVKNLKKSSKHSKPWSARIVDFGIYEDLKGKKEADSNMAGGRITVYGTKLIKETDQVWAHRGLSFGFRYVLLDGPDWDADVVIKVKHPSPLEDPETKKKFSTSEWSQKVRVGNMNWNTGWSFEHDWEIVPGEWLIELYVGDTKLAEKKFFVKDARE